MASIEEVKAQIAAALDAAQKAKEAVAAGGKSLRETLELVGEASRGSGHEKIEEALASFAAARQRLDESGGAIQQGIDTAQQYLGVI